MIPFEGVHSDVVEVLKKEGITEADLFNHSSDLYVGCKDRAQAVRIKNAGIWHAMSNIFVPQKGSNMDHYSCAVDIAFAAATYDFNKKHGNRAKKAN